MRSPVSGDLLLSLAALSILARAGTRPTVRTLKRYRVSGHRRRLWVSTEACQDVWHSAWHFWWCASVPWGDSWRITCCEVFKFSEEFAGSHEKAGLDLAGS